MTYNYKSQEYYHKFLELQEKLRKSEEERLTLEIKFNEMVQQSKEEEQQYYKRLKHQYKHFIESDRYRIHRNEQILQALERIEMKISMLSSKTERFKLLRQQYQSFLDRTNCNRLQRNDNIKLKPNGSRGNPIQENTFGGEDLLPSKRPEMMMDWNSNSHGHGDVGSSHNRYASNINNARTFERYPQFHNENTRPLHSFAEDVRDTSPSRSRYSNPAEYTGYQDDLKKVKDAQNASRYRANKYTPFEESGLYNTSNNYSSHPVDSELHGVPSRNDSRNHDFNHPNRYEDMAHTQEHIGRPNERRSSGTYLHSLSNQTDGRAQSISSMSHHPPIYSEKHFDDDPFIGTTNPNENVESKTDHCTNLHVTMDAANSRNAVNSEIQSVDRSNSFQRNSEKLSNNNKDQTHQDIPSQYLSEPIQRNDEQRIISKNKCIKEQLNTPAFRNIEDIKENHVGDGSVVVPDVLYENTSPIQGQDEEERRIRESDQVATGLEDMVFTKSEECSGQNQRTRRSPEFNGEASQQQTSNGSPEADVNKEVSHKDSPKEKEDNDRSIESKEEIRQEQTQNQSGEAEIHQGEEEVDFHTGVDDGNHAFDDDTSSLVLPNMTKSLSEGVAYVGHQEEVPELESTDKDDTSKEDGILLESPPIMNVESLVPTNENHLNDSVQAEEVDKDENIPFNPNNEETPVAGETILETTSVQNVNYQEPSEICQDQLLSETISPSSHQNFPQYNEHNNEELEEQQEETEDATMRKFKKHQREPQPPVQPEYYDQNAQNYSSNDQYPQYDENGQPVNYESNVQPVSYQYDDKGRPYVQQYDEKGQPYMQYVEKDQAYQYDGNTQQYDQQYYENDPNYANYGQGQGSQQYDQQHYGQYNQEGYQNPQQGNYDGSEQQQYDPNQQYNAYYTEVEYNQNAFYQGDDTKELHQNPHHEENDEADNKTKLMDMLETDTENSSKQENKVSNDSDFDFSNNQ